VEHVPNIETGTMRERIERLVAHVAEILVDSTFSRCIPALNEGAAQDPRLREFHYRYSGDRRRGLAQLVADGVAGGEFAPDTNADLAARGPFGCDLLLPAHVAPTACATAGESTRSHRASTRILTETQDLTASRTNP
jgi:hypothetical protein